MRKEKKPTKKITIRAYVRDYVELRQFKNNWTEPKIRLVLKLQSFSLDYTVRKKGAAMSKLTYILVPSSLSYIVLKRTYVKNFPRDHQFCNITNSVCVLQILTQSQPASFYFSNSFFCSIFSAIQVNR